MEPTQPNQWYVEAPPPPSLAHLVACLWEMRIPTIAERRVRILPNACVDIVIYASDAEMDNPIACGAVGGIQLGDDLIVGLNPVGDEGMSGIALLRASGTQATVTIVLNEGAGHDSEEAEHSHEDEDEEHSHEEGGAATPEA